MNYDDYQWIDTAKGSESQRNDVCTLTEFADWYGKQTDFINVHRSLYRFSRDYYQNWFKNKSVRGYKGLHILDYAFIDIDSDEGTLTDKIVDDLKRIFNKLAKEIDYNSIYVEFSGSKGFHLSIPSGLFAPEPDQYVYETHRVFIQLLTDDLYGLIDKGLYHISSLHRVRGSFNFKLKKETGWKNLIHPKEIESLTIEKVKELSLTRSKVGLSKEFITGEAYWKYDQTDLSELWKKAAEKAVSIKEGKRVFVGGVTTPDVPQCIANILKNISQPDMQRNYSLCILTAYLARILPSDIVKESALLLNAKFKTPLPGKEALSYIANVINRGYGYGCANPDSKFATLSFCNASGTLEDCPKFKKTNEKKIWFSAKSAMDLMIKKAKQGPLPIKTGIKKIDDVIGYLDWGDKITFQGMPSVGKSLITFRIARHIVEDLKKLNTGFLMFLPEQTPDIGAQMLTLQLRSYTLSHLYEDIITNRFNGETEQWFRNMKDYFFIANAAGFSTDNIKKTVDEIEQVKGIRIGAFLFDGTIFLKPGNPNAKELRAEAIAGWLSEYCDQKKIIGIFNVHLPKEVGNRRQGKEKKPSIQIRPELHDAKGTIDFANKCDIVVSAYQDEFQNVVLDLQKAKRRYYGTKVLPEPFTMFVTSNYMAYTADECQNSDIFAQFDQINKDLISLELSGGMELNL